MGQSRPGILVETSEHLLLDLCAALTTGPGDGLTTKASMLLLQPSTGPAHQGVLTDTVALAGIDTV